MKKIVVINHYGITPDQPGATRHYDMAKYFSEQKEYDIEFWMCGYNHHSGRNDEKFRKGKFQYSVKKDNLKIVKLKSTCYRNSNILRQLNITVFDFLTALKILFSRNIEIVILSVPPISIFNVLALKIRKIKLIADVEDVWPLFLQDMGMKNKFAIAYMNICSKYLYNHADGIEAVSEGMLNYVMQQRKNKSVIKWLSPLGVNLNLYNKENLKSINIEDKKWKNLIKIVYVGAHGKANDLKSVIEVAKYIEDHYGNKLAFIFIGDGEEKKYLQNLSKQLDVNSVYFEKAVPGSMVPSYLNLADICLTNLKKVESFKLVRPNKIFQYMAAKKPIICGIWGEAKEIVEEAAAGIYVDFTNTEKAAEKIIRFISSIETSSNYGENGYRYILKFGDRGKIFKDFYNYVKEIINK